MQFSELGLSAKTLEAVTAAGYTIPTPIQAEAIPPALLRRDVMGLAQTGSGKTGFELGGFASNGFGEHSPGGQVLTGFCAKLFWLHIWRRGASPCPH